MGTRTRFAWVAVVVQDRSEALVAFAAKAGYLCEQFLAPRAAGACRKSRGEVVVSVKDNGIGIASATGSMHHLVAERALASTVAASFAMASGCRDVLRALSHALALLRAYRKPYCLVASSR